MIAMRPDSFFGYEYTTLWHSDMIGSYGVVLSSRSTLIAELGEWTDWGYFPYRLTAALNQFDEEPRFTVVFQKSDQRLPRQAHIMGLEATGALTHSDLVVAEPAEPGGHFQAAEPGEPAVEVLDGQATVSGDVPLQIGTYQVGGSTGLEPSYGPAAPPSVQMGGFKSVQLVPDGLDAIMLAHMQSRNIRAGSLAVTYQGRLVFAHGYTWAEAGYPITSPLSAFYLQSISKALTSLGVHRLFGFYGLSPDEHFHPNRLIVKTIALDPPENEDCWKSITIGNLLAMQVDWYGCPGDCYGKDQPKLADELGFTMPLSKDVLIGYAAQRELTLQSSCTSGKGGYSNFGYVLLGRLIEEVTGAVSYAQWMKEEVWQQVGFSEAHFDARRLDIVMASGVPLPGQVPVEDGVPGVGLAWWEAGRIEPYGFTANAHTQDAYGGWVAAPLDLLRIYAALGPPENGANLIGTQQWVRDHMWGANSGWVGPKDQEYGPGWIGHNGLSHGGLGDAAFGDGLGIAYAFNASLEPIVWNDVEISGFLDFLALKQLVVAIKDTGIWETKDLWPLAGLG